MSDARELSDEALVEKFSDSSYCKIEGWGDDSGYEPERTELLNRLRARSVEGPTLEDIEQAIDRALESLTARRGPGVALRVKQAVGELYADHPGAEWNGYKHEH